MRRRQRHPGEAVRATIIDMCLPRHLRRQPHHPRKYLAVSTERSSKSSHRRLPLPVVMFTAVSLLNEISSQMVAPLIPILIAGVLAAGPIAIGAVEGVASVLAAIPAGLLFGLVWKLAGPAAEFGITALIALNSAAWLKLSVPAGTATGGRPAR